MNSPNAIGVPSSDAHDDSGSAAPDELALRLQRLEIKAYWRAIVEASWPFKMACIYLTIEYVRPQSIWPLLDGLSLGLISLGGGVVITLASSERRLPTHGSKLRLLIVLLCWIVLSILGSDFPKAGWSELYLYVSWIMAYFLITKSIVNERRYIVFLVLFMLFSFKMSQHGFRSWAGSGFVFNREGVVGAPGWFHNSGELGIQMCIFLPLFLHFAMAGWKQWTVLKRGLMVGVGATIVGAIVGSSSRGALIGSSAALLWMLLRSQYKFRGLVSIGVLAAIVWRILPVEFYRRLSAMGDDPDSVSRLTYWKYGWELMKEHPLLGIGYQAWYDTYAAHVIATGDRHKPEVCHNIFIQAGSELGFPGLLMVVGLVLSTFVLNSRTRRVLGTEPNARFLRLISLGLDAAMVGFLVSAQFVTVLYYPYLWIQLALTVALYNVVRRRAEVAGAK